MSILYNDKMTSNPKVSIIIPVYNGSNYLRKAIDSALSQTYKNVEIIVVNDGSNDEGKTEAIIKSYGDKIRYFYKENGGVSTALNLGIQKMTGEYFSWLSHDDEYVPNKISKQIAFINNNKLENTIVYTDFIYVDAMSRLIGCRVIHSKLQSNGYIPVVYGNIHGCTLLIPKKCFEQVGNFNEKLLTIQDYDLWFRMAGFFKFAHMPFFSVKSRVHNLQGSRTTTGFLNEASELLINMIKKLSDAEILSFEKYTKQFYAKVFVFVEIMNYRNAVDWIKNSIVRTPSIIWWMFFYKYLDRSWLGQLSLIGALLYPKHFIKLLIVNIPAIPNKCIMKFNRIVARKQQT